MTPDLTGRVTTMVDKAEYDALAARLAEAERLLREAGCNCYDGQREAMWCPVHGADERAHEVQL